MSVQASRSGSVEPAALLDLIFDRRPGHHGIPAIEVLRQRTRLGLHLISMGAARPSRARSGRESRQSTPGLCLQRSDHNRRALGRRATGQRSPATGGSRAAHSRTHRSPGSAQSSASPTCAVQPSNQAVTRALASPGANYRVSPGSWPGFAPNADYERIRTARPLGTITRGSTSSARLPDGRSRPADVALPGLR
jgi:hypothetical protein